MALRDQPYLPLYIQDFLTDEKLAECSATTTGVFIRLMCLMHKSDVYGKILLKQKYKQTSEQNNKQEENICEDFAIQIAKQMPYEAEVIKFALMELLAEKVCHLEGDYLVQKRMVHDNELSEIRAAAGKNGGKKTQGKNKQFASDFAKTKNKANTENEIEDEIANKAEERKDGVEGKQTPAKSRSTKEAVQLPLMSANLLQQWERWKEFKKKQFTFIYKSSDSELTAFNQLMTLAGNIEADAIKIIERSIGNGYKGFFPLNNNSNEKDKSGFKANGLPTGQHATTYGDM